MIIFYNQKKSIKTEDNFQRRKASPAKNLWNNESLSKKTTTINKVQSHLEQNSDQTFNCNFKWFENLI